MTQVWSLTTIIDEATIISVGPLNKFLGWFTCPKPTFFLWAAVFGLGPLFQMSKEKTHSTTNMFLANKLRGCFRAIAKSNLKRTARIKVLGSYDSIHAPGGWHSPGSPAQDVGSICRSWVKHHIKWRVRLCLRTGTFGLSYTTHCCCTLLVLWSRQHFHTTGGSALWWFPLR